MALAANEYFKLASEHVQVAFLQVKTFPYIAVFKIVTKHTLFYINVNYNGPHNSLIGLRFSLLVIVKHSQHYFIV